MRADDLLPVEGVGSGQTIAAVGLKETYTGDTLVATKVISSHYHRRKKRPGEAKGDSSTKKMIYNY